MLFPDNVQLQSGHVSIVVQGPFKDATDAQGHSTISVLRSARRYYADAEIIYSGWQGAALPLEVHEFTNSIILSTDPGPVQTFEAETGPIVENINRQIVSTVAGLRAANRQFAMKLRSDTLIVGNLLQPWLERQRAKSERTTLFQLPLVAASQYTRLFFFEYGGFRECIGHLSDLFFFGLKEDLLRFWDGPLIVPGMTQLRDRWSAATVEQILSIRFLVAHGGLPKEVRIHEKLAKRVGDLDWSRWTELLESNFIVLDDDRLGVRHPLRFARLGLSRLLFESDSSISAARGTLGYGRLLWFYFLKIVVYLEYQMKFAMRRLLGTTRYKSFGRQVMARAARLRH